MGAERRMLTVVFCDLVNSTELSQRLDPEDWRELLHEYHETCARVVKGYQGHIAQYLGDGLLIYFGYPRALEDGPRRAVLASLGILRAMRNQGSSRLAAGNQLEVRLGIHTGLTVVSEIGAGNWRERIAQGAVVNLAARLQGKATPGSVVISAETARLVEGYFRCRSLGQHTFKGFDAPVEVLEVVEEDTANSRMDVQARRGLPPLLAREREANLLGELWERAVGGEGSMVLLSGEAGVGKSRLLRHLQDSVTAQKGFDVWTGQCAAHDQDSAFQPLVDLLRRALRLAREETPAEQMHRVEGFLTERGFALAENAPLLANFVGVPIEAAKMPRELPPEVRKQRTVALLMQLIFKAVANRPGLLVLEDIHWADPSTLDVVAQVAAQLQKRRLLLLCTCRTDSRPPLEWAGPKVEIVLERLGPEPAREIVSRLSRHRALPEMVVEEIVRKSDGIPLFVEEITKAVLENEKRSRPSFPAVPMAEPRLEIPATLNDTLMARLDRLGRAKALAQCCSVLGREFTFEMVQALSDWPTPELEAALEKITAAELMHAVGKPPHRLFVFKHALIQDAAYQSILKRTRREYHRRAAERIPQRFPELAQEHPEQLAQHFAAAGDAALAIQYWLRAGEKALQRSANAEAIAQTRKGLACLATLPESAERDATELSLLNIQGLALVASQGFAAAQVGETYARATQLRQRLGGRAEDAPVLWGMWVFFLVRARFAEAIAVSEELLQLGLKSGESSIELEGCFTYGNAEFWTGKLELAEKHLVRALELYDRQRDHESVLRYGQDPGVSSYCYLSFVLWYQGYPIQAFKCSKSALSLGRELAHPFSIGWGLGFAGMLRVWSGEPAEALALAEETIRYCTEQVQPFWLHAAIQYKGWALVQQGQADEGLRLMDAGLAGYQAIGSITVQPFFRGLRAEAYSRAGRLEEALAFIDDALRMATDSGQEVSMSELYRIKGDLLRQQNPARLEEAADCFARAVAAAQATGARMRELQAQTSRSRLDWDLGRRESACSGLSRIYDEFTEGLDSRWLREARVLLQRWSAELKQPLRNLAGPDPSTRSPGSDNNPQI
jgi:class 3 adenylate cyclase/tetratricopeptide (TPR) repeat protein